MENNNKYEILLKSGKGSYVKDPLKLVFEHNGNNFSVNDLLNKIFALETELDLLSQALSLQKANEAKVDQLLAASIETLSTKVARLEQKQED